MAPDSRIDAGTTGRGSHGALTLPEWSAAFERVLCALVLTACLALVAYKLLLIDRLNVNWDEFLFLNHVHALARNEMTLLFQGAYAHLFLWLTANPGDEIDQIVVARSVMVALLGITAFLIWHLGRQWLVGFASFVPPLVYLSSLPVIRHGGSFRVDSMLAPLTLGVLLWLFTSQGARRRDWYAGAMLGAAVAVSIKAVLLWPMIVLILVFRDWHGSPDTRSRIRATSLAAGKIAIACAASAAALLFLHGLTLAALPADSLAAYGGRVAGKTLFDVPLFPQIRMLSRYFHWQPLPWLLIALGAIVSLGQRRFHIAALGLSLLPIAIYRNAFPYFYVVMLAPAVILAGIAVQELGAFLRSRRSSWSPAALLGSIAAGLLYQTSPAARFAWENDQDQQSVLVSAVHQIFPEPQNYVDRCGMISSFRKVNFFMSTWGMEDYRARGVPFMDRTIRRSKPGFILVNTPDLDPTRKTPSGLLAEDRELIRKFYPVYWGPIRVAGAEGRLAGQEAVELVVPFPATYRLATEVPVTVNGQLRNNGDLVDVAAGARSLDIAAVGPEPGHRKVALFLASAKPPPDLDPPDTPIFSPL
jgi:hypothetical protein